MEKDMEDASEESEGTESSDDMPQQSDRQMFTVKCSDCGKDAEVPFKPTEGKPVYCKECYKKKRRF